MSREKLLGAARADLVSLPELYDELAKTLSETHHDISGYRSKVAGSPAPLSMPVVHLADTRHKPRWHGEDPRQQDLRDRYGIAPTLEAWVRVLAEELPEWPDLTEQATVRSECATLVEWWTFICEQQWSVELAEDVQRITHTVRAALGIRPEYHPTCRFCLDPITKKRSPVDPVEANTHNLTSWEACAFGLCRNCGRTYPKGPALDALAQVQEPMPLTEISGVTGVPIPTLHRWHTDGLIAPVEEKRRGRRFDLAAVRAVANVKFGRKVEAG